MHTLSCRGQCPWETFRRIARRDFKGNRAPLASLGSLVRGRGSLSESFEVLVDLRSVAEHLVQEEDEPAMQVAFACLPPWSHTTTRQQSIRLCDRTSFAAMCWSNLQTYMFKTTPSLMSATPHDRCAMCEYTLQGNVLAQGRRPSEGKL